MLLEKRSFKLPVVAMSRPVGDLSRDAQGQASTVPSSGDAPVLGAVDGAVAQEMASVNQQADQRLHGDGADYVAAELELADSGPGSRIGRRFLVIRPPDTEAEYCRLGSLPNTSAGTIASKLGELGRVSGREVAEVPIGPLTLPQWQGRTCGSLNDVLDGETMIEFQLPDMTCVTVPAWSRKP